MVKKDYKIGDVIETVGGVPVRKVKRISPLTKKSGVVFHKAYDNAAVISPETVWRVEILDSDIVVHSEFNRIVVFNKSGVDIDIRFNGSTSNTRRVPTGCSMIETEKYFWKIDVYNVSNVTDVEIDEVVVEVSKVN